MRRTASAACTPAGSRPRWIQTTATLGLFLSLVVIILVRTQVGEEAFKAWGWRIPFLVSAILLALSLWIRLKLNESPVFQKMVEEGTTSKKPLAEAFANRANLKLVVLALVGLTAGQAVVWYTGQFYALFFLEKTLKVDGLTTNTLVATALLIGTPFFVIFGWLSDKIGRKPIILVGCLLAVLTYFPIFKALTTAANPALAAATASAPVTVIADPADCAFQFDPVGKSAFASSGRDSRPGADRPDRDRRDRRQGAVPNRPGQCPCGLVKDPGSRPFGGRVSGDGRPGPD